MKTPLTAFISGAAALWLAAGPFGFVLSGEAAGAKPYQPLFPRETHAPPEEMEWVEHTLKPFMEEYPHWRLSTTHGAVDGNGHNAIGYLDAVHYYPAANEGPTDSDLLELEALPGLARLQVRGPHVTTGGLGVLPRLESLSRLYLSVGMDSQLKPDDLEVIGQIKNLRQLHLYSVFENHELSWLERLESLEYLSFVNCPNIDDGVLEIVARIPNLRRLRLRDYVRLKPSDGEMERMAQKANTSKGALENYYRNWPSSKKGITGEGFGCLAGLSGLQELEIDGTGSLTPEGIEAITRLPGLRQVRFSQVATLDDRLVALLRGMPGMREVDVELCVNVKGNLLPDIFRLLR